MPLDRQSIERRDFPIARRGYDIDAVNEHLAMLADDYEATRRGTRPAKAGSVASAASEQVRVIVEVAEQSADEIVREAELESRQLRQDAREQAERLRNEAGQQARAHVAKVAEVAQVLLDRAEGMDRELGTVLDGLRSGIRRLSADLSLLQANVGEFRDATQTSPVGDDAVVAASEEDEARGERAPVTDSRAAGPNERGAPDHADAEEDTDAVDEADAGDEANAGDDVDAGDEVDAEDDPDVHAAALGSAAGSQAEGARMIALNMALNGIPREETERHLEENFQVEDVAALVDEAYMRAGQ